MSSKIRSMRRKMDRESKIPSRRVEIMEELWRGVVQIATNERTNPTMLVNRILADAIGHYQKLRKQDEEARTRLVQPVGGMGEVAEKIKGIREGKVKL